MASMNQGSQLIGTYRSCGRGFAVVDPERQREVDFTRLPIREASSPIKPRRATTEWFNPPRSPRAPAEGSSSR